MKTIRTFQKLKNIYLPDVNSWDAIFNVFRNFLKLILSKLQSVS